MNILRAYVVPRTATVPHHRSYHRQVRRLGPIPLDWMSGWKGLGAKRFEPPNALVERLDRELNDIWFDRAGPPHGLFRAIRAIVASMCSVVIDMAWFGTPLILAATFGVLSASLVELLAS